MMMMMMKCVWIVAFCAVITLTMTSPGTAQQPGAAPELTPKERVAALKQILAASQTELRRYQWIETTVVSLNGEEKSRKQQQCFYGADGNLTKVLLTQPAPEEHKRGLRGKIAESKKEELTDYMREAIDLVHRYVPPDHARVEASLNAGKVSVQVLQPGKLVRLVVADYLKAGDSLTLDIDLITNIPLAANVKTYLATPSDPVTLAVKFGVLQTGVMYTSGTDLTAPGKGLAVSVTNSGYRKLGP